MHGATPPCSLALAFSALSYCCLLRALLRRLTYARGVLLEHADVLVFIASFHIARHPPAEYRSIGTHTPTAVSCTGAMHRVGQSCERTPAPSSSKARCQPLELPAVAVLVVARLLLDDVEEHLQRSRKHIRDEEDNQAVHERLRQRAIVVLQWQVVTWVIMEQIVVVVVVVAVAVAVAVTAVVVVQPAAAMAMNGRMADEGLAAP